MLTTVEVRTDQGILLGLPLQDVSEGYIIAEISGLDPVKATLVSSSFAMLDGAQYQSSRREARNITLTLDLEPDYSVGSVQELRSRLYKFFMPKASVNLRFYMSDGLTVNISGRVESFESPLFTQKPQVSISIMCFSPDFYDPSEVTISGNTTPPPIFPAVTVPLVIDYKGTVETGVKFILSPTQTVTTFTIFNKAANDVQQVLEFTASINSGTVLTINTVSGEKEASLLTNGNAASILYGIAPYSNWINLYHGENQISVYKEGAAVPYVIKYTNKYGGL